MIYANCFAADSLTERNWVFLCGHGAFRKRAGEPSHERLEKENAIGRDSLAKQKSQAVGFAFPSFGGRMKFSYGVRDIPFFGKRYAKLTFLEVFKPLWHSLQAGKSSFHARWQYLVEPGWQSNYGV